MAYNKRLIFPTEASSIKVKETSLFLSESFAPSLYSNIDFEVTASTDIISGSAKLYLRPTGSGTLLYSSSNIPVTSSTSTTGEVSFNNITLPSSINSDSVFEITAKLFGNKQTTVSELVTSSLENGGIHTGATVATYTEGGVKYRVFRFLSSGTFTSLGDKDFDILLVGGGGGGGVSLAGGAGGGNVAYASAKKLSGTYTITVGAAGSGGPNNAVNGGQGGSTSIAGSFTQTATGGGGGESRYAGNPSGGGNGGGGADTAGEVGTADSAVTGFTVYGGYSGGSGFGTSTNYPGGGGGGAGANGVSAANSNSAGGNGGAGVALGTIYDGSNNYYWGGGGGGSSYLGAAGGGNGGAGGGGGGSANTGAGGTGGSGLNPGGNGINGGGNSSADDDGGAGGINTGGGGGASSHEGSNTLGTGGSGIVLIRYAV
jgi:hypothetical protein